MTTGRHSAQTVSDGIHIAHAFEYADASARTGASGLVAADVGKLAKQNDTLTWWVLVNHSPVTWKELTPGSVSETVTTLTESPANVFTYTSEDSTVTEIDISNFETTTQLNSRDTDNRNRTNHTGTQTASTISDFDSEVSNNVDVSANTAKVTNATHTGEVTGSGALTVDSTAISNKTSVTAAATDEILISDASDSGNLKKVTAQSIADLGGGGGGGDPSSWLDRSSATEDRFFVNSTNDFTTESSALSVNHTHTPNATGTYLIQLSYGFSSDTGTFDFDGELLVDDGATATTVRRKHKQEIQDAGGVDPDDGSGTGINGSSGTDQRNLGFLEYFHSATSGTAFNVRFQHACLGSNGVEATVKWSVLKIERWS